MLSLFVPKLIVFKSKLNEKDVYDRLLSITQVFENYPEYMKFHASVAFNKADSNIEEKPFWGSFQEEKDFKINLKCKEYSLNTRKLERPIIVGRIQATKEGSFLTVILRQSLYGELKVLMFFLGPIIMYPVFLYFLSNGFESFKPVDDSALYTASLFYWGVMLVALLVSGLLANTYLRDLEFCKKKLADTLDAEIVEEEFKLVFNF